METNNNIKDFNIAEALRYAPKGLKLYSPLLGEVRLEKVSDHDDTILVTTKYRSERVFFEDGKYDSNGECLLFPSKDHREWNNWQNILFPKSIGSVCVHNITDNKFILGKDGTYFDDNSRITGSSFHFLIDGANAGNYLLDSRYATPEETKEFFEELNKNSYEWDGKKVVRNKEYYSKIFKNQNKSTPSEKVSVLMDEINSIKQDIESLKESRNQARMRIDSLENWAIEIGNPNVFDKIDDLEKNVKALTNRLDAIAASLIRQKTFSCSDKAGDCVTLKDMKS